MTKDRLSASPDLLKEEMKQLGIGGIHANFDGSLTIYDRRQNLAPSVERVPHYFDIDVSVHGGAVSIVSKSREASPAYNAYGRTGFALGVDGRFSSITHQLGVKGGTLQDLADYQTHHAQEPLDALQIVSRGLAIYQRFLTLSPEEQDTIDGISSFGRSLERSRGELAPMSEDQLQTAQTAVVLAQGQNAR